MKINAAPFITFSFIFGLFAGTAQAGNSVQLNLDSTAALTICNAGIWRGTDGGNGDGDLSDELNVTYLDQLLPANDPQGKVRSVSYTAVGGGSTHALFDPNSFPIQKQVSSLQVALNSANYGTGWFIDTCYVGPGVEKLNNGADASQGFYTMQVSLSGMDPKYVHDSGLSVKMSYECDLRGTGRWTAAPGAELATVGFSPDVDALDESSEMQPTSSAFSWEYGINVKSVEVPRTCKVRVSFQENHVTGSRSWATPATQFSLLTSIND